jgi:hypothetical protein
MKRTISNVTYRAMQDANGSWSVIDCLTELAYRVQGMPMVLLTENTALALAELLNDVSANDRTLH